ncbi:MAG: RNA methyltransferase [Puniceicoccales bacterium]|jgi:TrmH family RNA methyltransferase|nr:RNA methyltransferase [Puniceicoccales bacterium]
MGTHQSITSRQNPLIRRIKDLHKAEHRHRERRFIVEGMREVSRALANGFSLEMLFLLEGQSLPANFKRIEKIFSLSAPVFEKISFRENPDGIIGIATFPEDCFPEKLPENALIVLLEQVEKPGNLGAIIRSAEAAACSLVILANPLTDLWNPSVIRASQGAIFAVPVANCSNEEAFAYLRQRHISIASTSPASTQCYWNRLTSNRLAIAVGNENRGLSEFWLKNCDISVRIPMFGGASDSLNAATATALCLYEARRTGGMGPLAE